MSTFVDSGSEESTEESYRAQIELDRKYLEVERDEFYQNRRQSGYEPTLYVQNIDRETTEDELRVWFSEFGPIRACRLQKNPNNFPRTNAFIHYYYTESCDKAIEAMNGKFRDKNVQEPLVVKWEQRHGTHYQNLFINRTAKMISKDELKDRQQQQQFNQPAQTALSSLFPTTAPSNVFPAAATTDPNLQQALLLLSNPAALISLLTNSANLQQQSLPPPLPPSLPTISPQISSQVSQQLSQRFDNTQRHDSKQHLSRNTTHDNNRNNNNNNNNDHTFHSTSATKIYINNVGPNTTEDIAKPIFAQYGTVVDMRLAPQNSYALVTYADNLSAQRAIAGLNGQSILAKDGMTLNVTFKTNKANAR